MKAILLLADAAQVAEGKLNLLGGGWSITGPAPTPSAIAIKIEVPWSTATAAHHFDVQLFDEDGAAVQVETPEGLHPVQIAGDFEVGLPEGVRPGTPIDVPLAVNVGPLPLPPNSRFTWRLTIDGETQDGWEASFSTRPGE